MSGSASEIKAGWGLDGGMDGGMDEGMAVTITATGRLDREQTASVSRLVQRATDADGVSPLSEHVSLHLRQGGDALVNHLLAIAPTPEHAEHAEHAEQAQPNTIVGYAHLDVTDVVEGPSAELVVDPSWRQRGVGLALAQATLDASPDGRLRLWSHGGHPAASRLAETLGMKRTRRLLQLRRSLLRALPTPAIPAGIRIRTFDVDRDSAEWIALNHRAFADHPEQGAWTAADLQRRIAEPWFDAQGFFLAERDEPTPHLVGFHWTKVHGNQHDHDHAASTAATAQEQAHAHGHDPIGEVYIVGIDPTEQGHGLGRTLTLVGLHHLRDQGLTEAMLYVEAENQAAIRLYEGLGFTLWDSDVMYAKG